MGKGGRPPVPVGRGKPIPEPEPMGRVGGMFSGWRIARASLLKVVPNMASRTGAKGTARVELVRAVRMIADFICGSSCWTTGRIC